MSDITDQLFDCIESEISCFRGDYSFLSNFYPCQFVYNNMTWRSAEHAYQAMKSANINDLLKIKSASTPGKAKSLGKTIEIRQDWEDVKIEIMRSIVAAKFSDPELARQLIATGRHELIEKNDWFDNFWGRVKDEDGDWVGKNWLGIILMEIRNKLLTGKL